MAGGALASLSRCNSRRWREASGSDRVGSACGAVSQFDGDQLATHAAICASIDHYGLWSLSDRRRSGDSRLSDFEPHRSTPKWERRIQLRVAKFHDQPSLVCAHSSRGDLGNRRIRQKHQHRTKARKLNLNLASGRFPLAGIYREENRRHTPAMSQGINMESL